MQRVKWKCNEEVVKFSWRVQEAFIEMLILKKKKKKSESQMFPVGCGDRKGKRNEIPE